jgi:hypothetical protein
MLWDNFLRKKKHSEHSVLDTFSRFCLVILFKYKIKKQERSGMTRTAPNCTLSALGIGLCFRLSSTVLQLLAFSVPFFVSCLRLFLCIIFPNFFCPDTDRSKGQNGRLSSSCRLSVSACFAIEMVKLYPVEATHLPWLYLFESPYYSRPGYYALLWSTTPHGQNGAVPNC